VASGQQRVLDFPFSASPVQWSEDGQRCTVRQVDAGPIIQSISLRFVDLSMQILKELMPPDRFRRFHHVRSSDGKG